MMPCAGFIVGLAKDRVDQEQHLHVVGIASSRRGVAAGVVAIGLHPLNTVADSDYRICVLRGKGPATRRTAGLNEHRAALWRTHSVERSADLEELAFEMNRMDFGMVGV